MSRPDYVKCIAWTPDAAWCGREIHRFEFVFLNVDHAASNGRNEGRLVACRDCVDRVIEALRNGDAEVKP